MITSISELPEKIQKQIMQTRLIVFDFDGVFTDNCVYVSQDGVEQVCCWRGDGLGLVKLKKIRVDYLVISTEVNPVVAMRCGKLNMSCIQGCKDKHLALTEVIRQRSLDMSQVAFMGNDINDLTCLQSVGLPIVVADAHEDVLFPRQWQTRHRGGRGAVREVCDTFEAVKLSGDVKLS